MPSGRSGIGARLMLAPLFVLGMLSTIACSGESAQARREDASRAHASVDSTLRGDSPDQEYRLISVEGSPLPWRDEQAEGQCASYTAAGVLVISGGSWRETDSTRVECKDTVPRVRTVVITTTGHLRIAGDTLVFVSTANADGRPLIVDRGLLASDTLHTGGRLADGPPRSFVRTSSTPPPP